MPMRLWPGLACSSAVAASASRSLELHEAQLARLVTNQSPRTPLEPTTRDQTFELPGMSLVRSSDESACVQHPSGPPLGGGSHRPVQSQSGLPFLNRLKIGAKIMLFSVHEQNAQGLVKLPEIDQ